MYKNGLKFTISNNEKLKFLVSDYMYMQYHDTNLSLIYDIETMLCDNDNIEYNAIVTVNECFYTVCCIVYHKLYNYCDMFKYGFNSGGYWLHDCNFDCDYDDIIKFISKNF